MRTIVFFFNFFFFSIFFSKRARVLASTQIIVHRTEVESIKAWFNLFDFAASVSSTGFSPAIYSTRSQKFVPQRILDLHLLSNFLV